MLACVMLKNRILSLTVLLAFIFAIILEIKSEDFSQYYDNIDIEEPQETLNFNFDQNNFDLQTPANPLVYQLYLAQTPTNIRDLQNSVQDFDSRLVDRGAKNRNNSKQEMKTLATYCIDPEGKIVQRINPIGLKANVNITVKNSGKLTGPARSDIGSPNKNSANTNSNSNSIKVPSSPSANVPTKPSVSIPSNSSNKIQASAPTSTPANFQANAPINIVDNVPANVSIGAPANSPNNNEANIEQKTKELRKIFQELYIAQAQVQLEANEIQRAQAIAASAQAELEEAANNVRILTAALHVAQQNVAVSAIRAQNAQLELAAHDQLLFAARQKVDSISAQMVALQAEEGIGSPKIVVDIPALLNRLKQPLPENEKPTPIPSILDGKSNLYDCSNNNCIFDHETVKNDLKTNEIISNEEKLIEFNENNNQELGDCSDKINEKINSKNFNTDNKTLDTNKKEDSFTNQDIKNLVGIIVSAATNNNQGSKLNQILSLINDPQIIQNNDPLATIQKQKDQQYIDNFLKNIQNTDIRRINRENKSTNNTSNSDSNNNTSTRINEQKTNTIEKFENKQKNPKINDYLSNFEASLLRPYLKSSSSSSSSSLFSLSSAPLQSSNRFKYNKIQNDEYEKENSNDITYDNGDYGI